MRGKVGLGTYWVACSCFLLRKLTPLTKGQGCKNPRLSTEDLTPTEHILGKPASIRETHHPHCVVLPSLSGWSPGPIPHCGAASPSCCSHLEPGPAQPQCILPRTTVRDIMGLPGASGPRAATGMYIHHAYVATHLEDGVQDKLAECPRQLLAIRTSGGLAEFAVGWIKIPGRKGPTRLGGSRVESVGQDSRYAVPSPVTTTGSLPPCRLVAKRPALP